MRSLVGADRAFRRASSRRRKRLLPCAVTITCLLAGEIGLSHEKDSNPRPAPTNALTGLVKSGDGDPIAGAAVVISTAEPSRGKPVVSRFCGEDCLKYAFTDDAGRFAIKHVTGDQKFQVIAGRTGYGPNRLSEVDAHKGPLTVTLSAPRLKTIDAEENDVMGHVVDPAGKPVAGAIIAPRGYMQGDTGLEGPMDGVAEAAITDTQGAFRIASTKRVTALHLEVRARGFVPQYFNDVATGYADRVLNLIRGATFRGRVVHNGQPLDSVAIGVCWIKHVSGAWFGPWETITDDEGRFIISNVTPDQELCLYGKMDSVKEIGTIPAINLTAADEDNLNLGDIPIVPGHRLKGRVMISDGRPLPPNLHVNAYRDGPTDGTSAPVLPDGHFELQSLPDEIINLGVRAIPHPFPFHLSTKNRSLDPHNPQHLTGRLDGDVEVTILLEPGEFEFPPTPATAAEQRALVEKLDLLRKTRIQGVSKEGAEN